MKGSLGAYMNRSSTSYKQIHSSRSTTALTQRKQNTKGFIRYPNGIIVGDSNKKGIMLFDDGLAVINIKNNSSTVKETLYCFESAAYCYEISYQLYSECMFYKYNTYLTLYTFKKNRQDGYQYTYDYVQKSLTKSLYKNNQLVQIIEIQTMEPHRIQNSPEFSEMYRKLTEFSFNVEGCKRLDIGETSVYFGQVKNNSPNGFGIILSEYQKYMGCFKDGLLQGYGSICFKNGDICEGLFSDGENNNCCRYTKSYGTVYFIDNVVSGQEQYEEVIQEYKERFTYDNHKILQFPMHQTLLDLKYNLDIIQAKRARIEQAYAKKQVEQQQSKSPLKKYDSNSPISDSNFSSNSNFNSKLNPLNSRLLMNRKKPSAAKFSLDKQKFNSLIQANNPLQAGNLLMQNIIQKNLNRFNSSNAVSQQSHSQNSFFDTIKIEQVHQDTVAQQYCRNIPRSLQVKIMDKQSSDVLFVKQKQDNIMGNYIMQMIKQNSNQLEPVSQKAISAVTDRIKKSRIFTAKKSTVGQITFTF